MEFSICVKVRYLLLLGMGLVFKLGLSTYDACFLEREISRKK